VNKSIGNTTELQKIPRRSPNPPNPSKLLLFRRSIFVKAHTKCGTQYKRDNVLYAHINQFIIYPFEKLLVLQNNYDLKLALSMIYIIDFTILICTTTSIAIAITNIITSMPDAIIFTVAIVFLVNYKLLEIVLNSKRSLLRQATNSGLDTLMRHLC
jgi:hypothetical protein